MTEELEASVDEMIRNNDIETRMVFSLADLFKSHDAEKHYDMAERLFKQWQSAQSQELALKTKLFTSCLQELLNRNIFHTINKITAYTTRKVPESLHESHEIIEEVEEKHAIKKFDYKVSLYSRCL